jgi:hypothetical protein
MPQLVGRPRKPRPKKPRRAWITDISATLNRQQGKCAVPYCFAHVPILGRGRALDRDTKKILCKACSMVLGLVARDRKRLIGLVEYLDATNIKIVR